MNGPLDLGVLIEHVNSLAADRGALEKIATAEDLTAELGKLGDRLIGYFVKQARAEGFSWTDIGSHLGVSRQAAQQRCTPPVVVEPRRPGRSGCVPTPRPASARRSHQRARPCAAPRPGLRHPGDILLGVLDDPEDEGPKPVSRV